MLRIDGTSEARVINAIDCNYTLWMLTGAMLLRFSE